MIDELKEGVDFIYDDKGRMVLTKEFHLKRGYCCGSNCTNCPYGNSPQDQRKKQNS